MYQFDFRSGTIDELVFRTVCKENEYRVPEVLNPDDFVIDVGAHIGSFAYLCWSRGSRNVVAYEADPENAHLARMNLSHTNVTIHQTAVWRSDLDAQDKLYHSGYTLMRPDGPDPVGINTGGGHVFASKGMPVSAVALDDIIGDRPVRILKLDCEGSEFPILLTSTRLKNVAYITGEYHLLDAPPQVAAVGNRIQYSVGAIADLLTSLRFRVEFHPYKDSRFNVGNFYAYNLDWK